MTDHETTEQTAQVEVLPPVPDPRALNAQRHGMLSGHVPEAERDAYAAHVQAVRASSGALGYLETRLADQAALALWRLDRVARHEAALSENAQREARRKLAALDEHGPGRHAMAAYRALSHMTGETPAVHRADPALSGREALRLEAGAALLERVAAGETAPENVGTCSRQEAHTLGAALVELLELARVPPAAMVRAMTGRSPARGESGTLENEEWTFQPEELPGLLTLYLEKYGAVSTQGLRNLAQRARGQAQRLRDLQREAHAAESDALALAALPGGEQLEKVTRYEAHLERVLYRALHDLEAARAQRSGQASPAGLLRGVLDEQPPE